MNLDLHNISLLYIHDDRRTALAAYRRYLKRRQALAEIAAAERNKKAIERILKEGDAK